MKNQGYLTPPMEHSKLPLIEYKEMEIHELSDKGFQIVVLKMFRKLQKKMHKQFNETRKTVEEQTKKFNKEKT